VKWIEQRLERQRPLEDFVVARDAPARLAWRASKRVIARVSVPAGTHDASPPASLAILFDTSASRAVDFAAKVEQLRATVEQLGRHVDASARLVVLPFDQRVGAAVYDGPISGFTDSDAQSRILRRQALGASNFELALQAAAKLRAERVVVITDGMITAGDRDASDLEDELRRVAKAGTQRLDVVAGRDRRDDDVLRTLVAGELPQSGVVIDAARSPEEIAMRLVRPTAPPTRIRIAGAKRVWPAVLRGVQAGDAALVYAEVDRPGKTLDVTLESAGSEPAQQRLDVVAPTGDAFTQAWVRADVSERLAVMAGSGDPHEPTLRKQLAELSVEHRILNELTAFIVLETEQDYARFGIERKRVPGDEEEHEQAVAEAPPPPEPAPEPIRAERSTGVTITRDEMRRMESEPGESRSFDAVVESDATATSDSAGMALAGSTGAESAYGVEPVRRARRRGGGVVQRHAFKAARAPKMAEVTLRSIRTRGGLEEHEAHAMAEIHHRSVEWCWLSAGGGAGGGAMTVQLHIAPDGDVERVDLLRDGLRGPRELRRCMDGALRGQRFSNAKAGRRVRYTFAFRDGLRPEVYPGPTDEVVEELGDPDRHRTDERAYAGNFAEVKRRLRRGEVAEASRLAWAWRRSAPEDLMALVALGEVAQAQGRHELAARAFGSIAELHPSNAAMLRFAAGRLQALGRSGLPLAIDTLQEAQRQRPDHPSSHRGLAWALASRGRYAQAFDALARGYDNVYPDGRFASAVAELGEELRIVAAAWLRAQPKQRATIEGRLTALGLTLANEPSLRFVLTWETDTNDVDLHIQDGRGGRAWYSQPTLASGGTLLADVTTGFGPESFVIDGEPAAYPYYLAVHYYSRGPMGYGMGQVQVIHHDGEGKLDIETLPFVAMQDQAKLLVGAIQRR
jgi:tetratricopeptide (TPR) repeat protein